MPTSNPLSVDQTLWLPILSHCTVDQQYFPSMKLGYPVSQKFDCFTFFFRCKYWSVQIVCVFKKSLFYKHLHFVQKMIYNSDLVLVCNILPSWYCALKLHPNKIQCMLYRTVLLISCDSQMLHGKVNTHPYTYLATMTAAVSSQHVPTRGCREYGNDHSKIEKIA